MKKIISFLVISLFLSLSSVSADDTWTGGTSTGNTAPVANFDSVNTTKNVPVTINVLANDTDINWDLLVVTWTGNLLNGKASFTSTWVTFTPNLWFVGIWSFYYTISDNHWWTWTWYVNVDVKNTAPVANNDVANTTKNTAVKINVLANDTDFDSDALVVVWTTNAINGTTSFTSTWVTFTPTTWFLWSWSFNYTINDTSGWSSTWYVTVEVTTKANTAPVANNDTKNTAINTPIVINVLSNDTDADWDILTVIWTSSVLNGTTSFTSTGVTFTPTTWFLWTWSFSYTISDWSGGTDIWDVQVRVLDSIDNSNNNNNNNDDEDADEDNNNNNNGNDHKNNHWQKIKKSKNKSNNWREWSNSNKKSKAERDENKLKYKDNYKNRYGRMISWLSDSKAQSLIDKIDSLTVTIVGWSYSDDTKAKLLDMLSVLKEIILER